MLIRSWIAQKLAFLMVVVNIFYDSESKRKNNIDQQVILEFAFKFSFKSSEMVRLTT